MIGLSLWCTKESTSQITNLDEVVIKILGSNTRFLDEYYVITNNQGVKWALEAKGITTIDYEDYLEFEKSLSNRSEPLAPNFASDILTMFSRDVLEFTLGKSIDDTILYIDSDFLITNPILLDEISTLNFKGSGLVLFNDTNYYLVKNSRPVYVNAHLSCYPLDCSKDKIEELQSLFVKKLRKSDLDYRDMGPRFTNSKGASLLISVLDTVNPNTPQFGNYIPPYPSKGAIFEVEVPYRSDSLGIHCLFSLFKMSGFSVNNIKIGASMLKICITW